ncbi:MAG: RNA methyltransferase [Nitrospinae bacterium]|nr:RNA methyltransferase [Nitrospinota bacterium]
MTDMGRLSVALVHHPCVNKEGRIVTTSVTTLDVHDFARLCRTYAVADLFIVTPLPAQRRLVERLSAHWLTGFGAACNPSRKEALTGVKVIDSIEAIYDNYRFLGRKEPKLAVTSAQKGDGVTGYDEGRALLAASPETLLLFGTGFGLADEVMERADIRLAPIEGIDGFNHLSVRCAAAIILDRLRGAR